MAQTALGGAPVNTVGDLPAVGSPAPSFSLTKVDLEQLTVDDLAGKKVVLNVFPSVDTATCATSVRTFNARAAALEGTVVLCVSADLPFALKRFCGAEGLDDVVPVSTFRSDFGQAYGLTIADTKMAGLMARAVLVLDEHGTIVYEQLVPEIANEPDYDSAIAALG
jgi:thiol peroxidase